MIGYMLQSHLNRFRLETFKGLQFKMFFFFFFFLANSVDPDETAHNEPSHQDLHCLPIGFDFCLRPLFRTMVLTRFKDVMVHLRKIMDERVKCHYVFSLTYILIISSL